MQTYKTKVNKVSAQYQDNYKRNQGLVADLNAQLQQSLEQGKPEHVRRHIEGGRLLARDRIELLLDQVRNHFPQLRTLIQCDQCLYIIIVIIYVHRDAY
jgi:acetyl-CoA carboxylase carboxyltransferase component